MGVGKTACSLTAFVKLHKVKVKKLLVIAPLKVVKTVWAKEIESWEHTKHLTYSVCVGTAKQRLKALSRDVDVYIINQESIVWMYNEGFKKYGMIVVDESQGFKNYASLKFKSLKKFTSRYMVLLTGTPIPNGYMDVWSQQFLLDRGKLLEVNITKYRRKYFYKDDYRYICTRPDEIGRLLRGSWISMKSEDYLELPDKIINCVSVEIDNLKEYKKFADNFIIEINDKKLVATSKATLANKLLQYCNGAVYQEDGGFVEIHSNKLDALETIINDHSDESILVAFNFKCDESRIKARFKNATTLTSKNVETVVKQWNDKKVPLLLCQCSTAKGLNLQHGGRIIVWFGLTWNMESYQQFNARLYRQGQLKPVVIYHLVASSCKDEEVLKALKSKTLTQDELMKILKEGEKK